MFCKECGNELKEGDKFCVNCGQSVHYENVRRRVNSGQAIIRDKQNDIVQEKTTGSIAEEKSTMLQPKNEVVLSNNLIMKAEKKMDDKKEVTAKKVAYTDKTERIVLPTTAYCDKTEKLVLPDELMLFGKKSQYDVNKNSALNDNADNDTLTEVIYDDEQTEFVYDENYDDESTQMIYDDTMYDENIPYDESIPYDDNMYTENENYDNTYQDYDNQGMYYEDAPQDGMYMDNNYEQNNMPAYNEKKNVKGEAKKIGVVLLIAVVFVGVCVIFVNLNKGTKSTKTQNSNNYNSSGISDTSTPSSTSTATSSTTDDAGDDESSSSDGDYIFPNSDTEYLERSDLIDLSEWDLCVARNEIYARHGRKFENNELMQYFESKSWYEAKYESSEFSESLLSDVEKTNKELIIQIEKEKGYR